MEDVKTRAVRYYELTGKPLGITGEFGEYLAAKHLALTLTDARMPGYDATDTHGRRIQIKARAIPRDKKRGGQRLGRIGLDHAWDCVLLVLMDDRFEPVAMYEADRQAIEAALLKPGSRARNERGALSITTFIRIGKQVWPE